MSASRGDGIDIQERDLKLLHELLHSRVLTRSHAAALHFEGRAEYAKKRIQKLKAAGLVGERRRRPYEPAILFLTRAGYAMLQNRGALDDPERFTWATLEKRLRVSDLTLRHELLVMDVKTRLCSMIAKTERYQVAEFSTWCAFFQFYASPMPEAAPVLVKPDGFIRIREREDDGATSEHTFFLEIDRSNEAQRIVATKAACYASYYRTGGFAEMHGKPGSDYASFPFRVLMVFQNAERRNNAAERMLQNDPPVRTQVWLTTLKEFIADPLGTIWVQPQEFQRVMSGADGGASKSSSHVYRRDLHREATVEAGVVKTALL